MENTVILGCGPSSMFITMACNEMGIIPTIFGIRRGGQPSGAFYYHWLPEKYAAMVTKHRITYEYIGTEEYYLQRQWGRSDIPSSFGKYHDEEGYDPYVVLDRFLAHSEANYIDAGLMGGDDIFSLCKSFYRVFCTFPILTMRSDIIQVRRPVIAHISSNPENIIIYNGSPEENWVRKSNLFGAEYIEYADVESLPAGEKFTWVRDIDPKSSVRPIDHPRNLYLVGRYAEAKRSMLAHEAYNRAKEILHAT